MCSVPMVCSGADACMLIEDQLLSSALSISTRSVRSAGADCDAIYDTSSLEKFSMGSFSGTNSRITSYVLCHNHEAV